MLFVFLGFIELQIIQEMSLELNKKHQVAGHRNQLSNDSFRRERSDLCRRSAVAEARVVALEVCARRLVHVFVRLQKPLSPTGLPRLMSVFYEQDIDDHSPGTRVPEISLVFVTAEFCVVPSQS